MYRKQEPAEMLPVWRLEKLCRQDCGVERRRTEVHLALLPGSLPSLRAGAEAQLLLALNRFYSPLGAVLIGWKDLQVKH